MNDDKKKSPHSTENWMRKAGDFAADLFWTVKDAWDDYFFQKKQARKREARLKNELSPEKYKRYQSRQRQQNRKRVMIKAGGILLIVVAVAGIWKGLSFVGGKIFSRKEPAAGTTVSVVDTETEKIYPEKEITIGSTGCMLLHSPFISSYPDAEGKYDFSSVYKYITPYYSAPDFMTCEFEGALGGENLGYSGYPNFKSPDVIIENIRDSGVDLQLVATNHIYDGWTYGFHRTMDVYEEKKIPYTGIRRTAQDKQYYIADIDGVQVGFMDYVYETNGEGTNLNGMQLEQQDWDLVNSFKYNDLEAFYQEASENIRLMKAEGARFIVADMHWGEEYQLQEADYQREMAQKLCDLGVDALIGGHPHCEQPVDVFEAADGSHAMFCIFSVGNALSNQRAYLMDRMPTGHTEDGVMVTLKLHQSADGTVAISGVDILPTWVYRFQDNGSKYYILPLDDVANLESKTGIIGIEAEAQASYDRTMEELGPGLQKAKQVFETADISETESEAETGE